jgi:hypothetical protein
MDAVQTTRVGFHQNHPFISDENGFCCRKLERRGVNRKIQPGAGFNQENRGRRSHASEFAAEKYPG